MVNKKRIIFNVDLWNTKLAQTYATLIITMNSNAESFSWHFFFAFHFSDLKLFAKLYRNLSILIDSKVNRLHSRVFSSCKIVSYQKLSSSKNDTKETSNQYEIDACKHRNIVFLLVFFYFFNASLPFENVNSIENIFFLGFREICLLWIRLAVRLDGMKPNNITKTINRCINW